MAKSSGFVHESTLKKCILETQPELSELVNSLPASVKPCSFAGFDITEPSENTEALLGWSYDWSDKGNDPPPWADWGDKTV